MTAAVIVLADISSTGAISGVRTEGIALTNTESAALESAFLDLIQARLDQAGTVLVVHPGWSWRRQAAVRLVRLARGALGTDRIAGIPLALPPLALSLVADQLSHLAPYVAPGVLASVAHRLPDHLLAGAWVNSVTGLREISVPLTAHIASYLPGGFMVTVAPRPGLHRVSARRPLARDDDATPKAALIVSEHGGDTRWLQNRLAPSVGIDTLVEVPPQPASTAFWGTRKYIEFVAPSADPQALTRATRSAPYRLCTWCGEPTALATCPFCEMHQEPTPPGPAPLAAGSNVPTPAPARAAPVNSSVVVVRAPTSSAPAVRAPAQLVSAAPAPGRGDPASLTRPDLADLRGSVEEYVARHAAPGAGPAGKVASTALPRGRHVKGVQTDETN